MGEKALRIFNTTACAVTVLLATWTFVGGDISRPLQKVSLFEKLSLLEIRDRLSPAIVVFVVVCAFLLFEKIRIDSVTAQLAIAIVTTTGFIFSISSYLIDDDVAWAGLGKSVAVITFALATTTLCFPNSLRAISIWIARFDLFGKLIALVVLVAVYLPSIAQFSGGITDLFASSTVINELLLPVTGITPLGNFATQYSSMLGWPILALKSFSPQVIMNGVLIWLFMLTLAQILVIAAIGKLLLPRMPYLFVLLYVSSLIFMKGEKQDEITGSIVGSFFSIPSRTFFPTVLIFILVKALFGKENRQLYQIVLGALLPITALNNLEFGVPAVIAAGVVVLVFHRRRRLENFRIIILILVSGAITLGLIALAFAMRSAPLDLGLWTAMVRAQGSGGYMNSPMPIIGTYLFVFALLSAGFIVGTKTIAKVDNEYASRSAAVAIFAATWGVLSMPYYTGRSWPSHIQVFFVPVTLCILGIAGVFYHLGFFTKKNFSITEIVARIPLMMVLMLPIATLVIAPDPRTEWPRATGGGSEWSYENQRETKVVKSVVAAIARYEIDTDNSVYFGDQYASTVQLLTGLRNGLGVNTLEYSLVSAELRSLACRRLPDLNPQFVISQNDDTRINFVGPSLLDSSCPGMEVLYAPDDIGVTVFSYTKP